MTADISDNTVWKWQDLDSMTRLSPGQQSARGTFQLVQAAIGWVHKELVHRGLEVD